MSDKPLVSVIIPTYNYGKYIGEAVESILASDFPANQLEIIVVDDGSTDNTSEIIKVYKDKVKYIAQENTGKAWATKIGINEALGEYLFNLDADDIFLSNKIKNVVEVFETDKSIVHVAHPAICWHVNNNIKKIESIPNYLKDKKISGNLLLSYFYRRNMLFGGGSTFAARTKILKDIPISKEVDMLIDEYLVLFALSQGNSFFISNPLSIWRIHERNFSNANSKINTDKNKERRILKSMDAVLALLFSNSFSEDIQKLYLLKIKVNQLAVKEELDRKAITDILELWVYIINNIKTFKYNFLKIVKNYNILNRTLPTFMIKKLKNLKTNSLSKK